MSAAVARVLHTGALCVLVAAGTCGATSNAVQFTHGIIATQGPGGADCCTDVLALGDIDADGDIDVVIGAENDPRMGLVWYEFPSWRRHDIAQGQFTTDGRVVDFDADGDVDIVVGELPYGLVWFEQRKDQRWVRHALARGYVHDLVVADFDGNGVLDVAIADKNALKLVTRTSTSVHESIVIERAGEGLDAADVDGDGDIDLAYANVWLEQREARWFVHDIAADWPVDTRVRIIDLNGDSRADVVLTASEGTAPVAWFEQPASGAGREWRRHDISLERLTGAHALCVEDFNLDGRPDVVVAEMNTSRPKRVLLYVNRGAEGWSVQPLSADGSHNMHAADLDADGAIDIVGKNFQGRSRPIEWWRNRTTKVPTGHSRD